MKYSSNYILKHKDYIDYRINLLNHFISTPEADRQQRLHEIISALISFSTNSCYSFDAETASIINDIRTIIARWDFLHDGDIIGYIYMNLECRLNLKEKGQFFTPDDIVTFLVDSACSHHSDEEFTLLDPACGSGQFLMKAYALLYHREQHHNENDRDLAERIASRIFGFDSDPMAVAIARFNLMKISGLSAEKIQVYVMDYLSRHDKHLFTTSDDAHLLNKKFNVIIGNPPWRSKFSPDEKKYYKSHYSSVQSGMNTFSLFFERSFDFIRRNGFISFLIPEAYLNIKAHMSSRRYVLQQAKIKNIYRWGDKFKGVFAPAVSLLLQYDPNHETHAKNIIRIYDDTLRRDGIITMIPQDIYNRTPENIFSIHHTTKAAELLQTIENNDCIYLKNRARFFLGVVTGNNLQFIMKNQSEAYPDPIIVGRDLHQYKINFSNHYFKFSAEQLQQVAPQGLYLTKNKLLYKFISTKLTFALDINGYYSLNNVNGFIPIDFGNTIETTLAILNSRVMQYFYQNNFFTLKVLRGNIERLPLKLIRKETQKKIVRLVRAINNADGKDSITCRETIEDIIFHEYNISERDAYSISDSAC